MLTVHCYPVFCHIILLQSKFAALVLVVVVVVVMVVVAAVAIVAIAELLVIAQLLLPANSYN